VDLNRPRINWGRPFDKAAQDPMNTHSFFFSFDPVLPRRASKPASGAPPSWGAARSQKNSCSPRLHCAESSCVVLSKSLRRHGRSGRDWPDLWRCRTSAHVTPEAVHQEGHHNAPAVPHRCKVPCPLWPHSRSPGRRIVESPRGRRRSRRLQLSSRRFCD
jgi:hypothetical protein